MTVNTNNAHKMRYDGIVLRFTKETTLLLDSLYLFLDLMNVTLQVSDDENELITAS